MKKIKIYKGDEVREERGMNSAGGYECAYGTEYYFAEDYVDLYRRFKCHDFAGILFHSVGPYGESTGIFSSMRGTAIEEICEIVQRPTAQPKRQTEVG